MASQLAGVPAATLFSTVCVLGVVSVLSTAIYRLYFHPLAEYPGPFWARLSVWPSYLHTIKQDRHTWLLQLQDQYGPTFRYRPDSVVINTPTGYRTIFGPKGNVKKTESYYRVWPHNVNWTNTWNVTNVEAHARKRRVLNQAFSDRTLRGAEPHIHSTVDRWLTLMKEQIHNGQEWTKSLNMANEVNYLVLDILGDLCFGKSFDMKEPDSDIKHVPHLMGSFLQLMNPIAFSPFASWWVWAKPRGLDWLLTFAVPEDLKKWQGFVGKNLDDRAKKEMALKESGKGEGEAPKDFFHYLFDAKDPETGETGYDLQELYGECEVLTIAGSDTTAIITAAITFYLATNPRLQEKLAREVTSTFAHYGDIVAGPKLNGCQYLNAFIRETLRMTPPVPADLAREVLPGGTTVEGHFFPQDTKVSTCLYCLSYSKDVYTEPFKFRPERWIANTDDPEGDPVESVELAESGFCAFSYGSRSCVGMTMAWIELRIVLAKLIWMFELKQDPKNKLGGGSPELKPGHRDPGVYQIYDAFAAMRDGPMVRFKERHDDGYDLGWGSNVYEVIEDTNGPFSTSLMRKAGLLRVRVWSGLGFQVFNATNDPITTKEPTEEFLNKAEPGAKITRKMGEYEALFSNRKIREVLGSKEEHNWRQYYKPYCSFMRYGNLF
ncbi:Uu.00g072750.m01.CDS01 [Anthostomella pinea]|uniref:Uu.00g072750.m01.CDS01 n=1 Tax=Anthostomella pinea TaxID=933095 RepID=A0AAI8VVS4_9PEZI|nr:Uu.00g072750.m01.CDS01 [Anthostomella pinea]